MKYIGCHMTENVEDGILIIARQRLMTKNG